MDPGAQPHERPRASVVVVTHNNAGIVGPCLDAIRASGDRLELIVVDNASTDDTPAIVEQGSWGARLVVLDRNMGFARAVNVARDAARGPLLVLVNSDAFPDPPCIGALLQLLEREPRAGIVGARLRYPSGALQPSAGTFPSLLGDLWVALFLHRMPLASRLEIGYFASERLYRRAREVDWVSGAVCAARREAGPVPSSSFMYGEDVEWARACRERGLTVWLEPTATAIHVGRASVDATRQTGFAQHQRVGFELAWFERRRPAAKLLARAIMLLHALLRIVAYGSVSLVHAARRGSGGQPRGGRGAERVGEYVELARTALRPTRAGDRG